MVFSSILFLCLFLPITVLIYDLLPGRFRNGALLVASLIFYGWGEPKYILIMLFSTVFDYTNGRLIERLRGSHRFSSDDERVQDIRISESRNAGEKRENASENGNVSENGNAGENGSVSENGNTDEYGSVSENGNAGADRKSRANFWCRLILILSVTVNLGLLCFFKYTDFAIENINRLAGTNFGLLELALPVGISFYTFQTLSYTIDVYRGKVRAQHNIIDFGMYICLFPQLIAGPIVRYTEIAGQLKHHPGSDRMRWEGLCRFTAGLGKKVLLANQIGLLWEEVSALNQPPAATAWLGLLAFSFQIYFDFSGYSDMAIGLGKMFGFTFPENFRYPYEAASITDFWRRWHMTLGAWFREYLYIPLGGNRRGLPRQLVNLLIVWSLTGLWHGAGWNFLLWGLYYFVLLAVEKIVLLKWMRRWRACFRHLYTLLCVALGWALFACEDLGTLKSFLAALFGANGFANGMSMYYLLGYGMLFAILAVGATSLPKRAAGAVCEKIREYVRRCQEKRNISGVSAETGRKKIETEKYVETVGMRAEAVARVRNKNIANSLIFVLQMVGVLAVIVLSLAFLVGDSYNPFLYFRF